MGDYYAGSRVRERSRPRAIWIDDQDVENVREKEMAMVVAPPRPGEDQYAYDSKADRWALQRDTRNDSLDIDYAPPRRSRSTRGAALQTQRSPSSSSSSDSDRRQRRRRRDEHDGRHRRARSERDAALGRTFNYIEGKGRPPPEKAARDEENPGILWYSGKPRNEGNILERSFDSSYDGLIAAVAGAAIGSMTARSFGGYDHYTEEGRKKNKWKTLAAGVAGAAVFNAAENGYRVYTEEKYEVKEQRREERREDRRDDRRERR